MARWEGLELVRGFLCMVIRREEDYVETRNICKHHKVLDRVPKHVSTALFPGCFRLQLQ